MVDANNFSIITPHAAFLVWNYSDRMGSKRTTHDAQKVDQQIISTLSLKSISTNKTKSAPSGTFEIKLAPTKNWVQLLTPGSWCVILMARDKLKRADVDSDDINAKADKNKVKFFGRIDSVRVSVNVDQTSGARVTEYIVTGVDWGSIFNSNLLVDPAMAQDAKNNDTPLGYVSQLIYNQANKGQLNRGVLSASTYNNIKVLLAMWGKTDIEIKGFDFKVKPEVNFKIPQEVKNYFGFTDEKGRSTDSIADLLHIYHGSLNKINNAQPLDDSYDGFLDSFGIIHGEDILNQNNMWSVILSITNPILNEIICDLRWEDDKPKLALYKRIRPFIIDRNNLTANNIKVGDKNPASVDRLEEFISEYKNLRRIEIPLKEVLSFNGGTNWADKINFIEVKVNDPSFKDNVGSLVRLNAQFYDEDSFSREGLRPFIAKSRFLPNTVVQSIADSIKKKKKKEDIEIKEAGKYVRVLKNLNRDKNNIKNTPPRDVTQITQWKYIFKEWYFDVHRMLNGSITFMGQDGYIQVGDNLIVDAKVAGYAENMTLDQIKSKKAYLLMHVENISHSFVVNSNGTRSFTTSVNFVRGIITGDDGAPLFANSDGTIDQDAKKIGIDQELNNHNTWTKTYMDPD